MLLRPSCSPEGGGLLGEEARSILHSSAAKPCTKRSKSGREPGAESAVMYMKSYTQLFFLSTYTRYCFFTPSSAALSSVRNASRPSKLTLACEITARSVNCRNRCWVSEPSGTSSPSNPQRPLTATVALAESSRKASRASSTSSLRQALGTGPTRKRTSSSWYTWPSKPEDAQDASVNATNVASKRPKSLRQSMN